MHESLKAVFRTSAFGQSDQHFQLVAKRVHFCAFTSMMEIVEIMETSISVTLLCVGNINFHLNCADFANTRNMG